MEMPGKIFINYRREDSRGEARGLFDRLSIRFPRRVFMDVSVLDPGVDFVQAIDKEVSGCDAFVVVIGKDWLTSKDSNGQRRLDDPQDFVRLEIASALKRNIPVIPALVGGAAMPTVTDLPADLHPLTRRNAVYLTDQGWDDDVHRLVGALERVLSGTKKKQEGTEHSLRRWIAVGGGAVTLVLVLMLVMPRFVTSTPSAVSSLSPSHTGDPVPNPSPTPPKKGGGLGGGREPGVKPQGGDRVSPEDESNRTGPHGGAPDPDPGVSRSPADWTHSVRVGNLILEYRSTTGEAQVERIDRSGNHATVKQYPAGSFSTGWTSIVSTPNGILFYNSSNGSGAVGRIDESGNHTTVKKYNTGSFSRGWTNVVSTPNGILFYNRDTGSGAVGRIDASGNFNTIKTYPDGSFAKGWTSIVSTPRGIEYRNAATGATAIGYIDAEGNHITR